MLGNCAREGSIVLGKCGGVFVRVGGGLVCGGR